MELYTKALENNQLPQDFKPQPYLTLALLPATIEFKLTVLGSATRLPRFVRTASSMTM